MFPALLEKLQQRRDLTSGEAAAAMAAIMDGVATPAQTAGLLTALRLKGERPAEIVGLARTMRARAVPLRRSYPQAFDTCGTGGDGGGTFNVKSYGATGNGTTDDTAALQAALDAVPSNGGIVYLPVGTYKVTTGLTVKSNTTVRGESTHTTIVDLSSKTGSQNFIGFTSAALSSRITIEYLKINMATGANITSQSTVGIGIRGVDFGTSSAWMTLRRIWCIGGNSCFNFNSNRHILLEDCYANLSKNTSVVIYNSSSWAEIRGGLYGTSGMSDQVGNGNIVIGTAGTGAPTDIAIRPDLVDEGGNSSVHVYSGTNIYFQVPRIYSTSTNASGTGPGYGIRVGSATVSPTRVTIVGTRIEPFGAGQPDATILLYGSGHRLIGVSTSTTHPVDILDNAKDTQYFDVNGSTSQFQSIVADAVIPYGSVVMSDAGTDLGFPRYRLCPEPLDLHSFLSGNQPYPDSHAGSPRKNQRDFN